MLPEFPNKLKPIHFWHHQIEQDHPRLFDLHHIQRPSPVLRFQDAPSRFRQLTNDHLPIFGVIFLLEQKSGRVRTVRLQQR